MKRKLFKLFFLRMIAKELTEYEYFRHPDTHPQDAFGMVYKFLKD